MPSGLNAPLAPRRAVRRPERADRTAGDEVVPAGPGPAAHQQEPAGRVRNQAVDERHAGRAHLAELVPRAGRRVPERQLRAGEGDQVPVRGVGDAGGRAGGGGEDVAHPQRVQRLVGERLDLGRTATAGSRAPGRTWPAAAPPADCLTAARPGPPPRTAGPAAPPGSAPPAPGARSPAAPAAGIAAPAAAPARPRRPAGRTGRRWRRGSPACRALTWARLRASPSAAVASRSSPPLE